jgi:hypothetical protein
MGEKFTPGPYARQYTHGVGWSLHVPADFDGKVPGATIRVATAIGNEPDACLFGAAPDLYEAHDRIANGDWLGEMRFAEDTDADFLLRVIAKMRQTSRAALAKAQPQPGDPS